MEKEAFKNWLLIEYSLFLENDRNLEVMSVLFYWIKELLFLKYRYWSLAIGK